MLAADGELPQASSPEDLSGLSPEAAKAGFDSCFDGIIFTGEEVARMSGTHEGWNLQYRFADPSGQPLKAGEYLMPVRIGEKELVTEVSELLNLFAADGRFISEHDREEFWHSLREDGAGKTEVLLSQSSGRIWEVGRNAGD